MNFNNDSISLNNNDNISVELKIQKNSSNEILINGNSREQIVTNKGKTNLSFYEYSCGPRIIKNPNQIQISHDKLEKIIKQLLSCSICWDIFNDPVNIKNCLHKFCKKCIEDYNRRNKKECATCRKPVETRRAMREDMKIKAIIKCLITNIDKFNEEEAILINNNIKNFCFDSTKLPHKIDIVQNNNSANLNNNAKTNNANNISSNNDNNQYNTNNINNQYNTNNINNTYNATNNLNINQKQSIPSSVNIAKVNDENSLLNKKISRGDNNSLENLNDQKSIKKARVSNEVHEYTVPLNYVQKQLKLAKQVSKLQIINNNNILENSHFQKYMLFVNNDVTIMHFCKYVCNKLQKYSQANLEKIKFYCYDREKRQCELEKNLSIGEIKELYKITADEIKLYYKLAI